MFYRRRSIISIVVLGLLSSAPSLCQSTFGSITGSVKDDSGAMVPTADVEVTNEGTGTTRRVTTGSAGVFSVPNLDLGTYKIRISGKGFTTFERSNLNLSANQIINLNVELVVGGTTTLVEVNAPSPVISTEANDLSGYVNHEAIEELPLVVRHT